MLGIYQIYYNLEDYENSGDVITSGAIENLNIYDKDSNILAIGAGRVSQNNEPPEVRVTKIGIQAPPGTGFYILGENTGEGSSEFVSNRFIVGKNGIFEFDGQGIIIIKNIYFEKLPYYQYDKENSETEMSKGISDMADAKTRMDEQLAQLTNPNSDTYYSERDKIISDAFLQYRAGYSKYLSGKNGVYKPTEDIYDLHNIIIDYVVEG